jgi:hypothetical protein
MQLSSVGRGVDVRRRKDDSGGEKASQTAKSGINPGPETRTVTAPKGEIIVGAFEKGAQENWLLQQPPQNRPASRRI